LPDRACSMSGTGEIFTVSLPRSGTVEGKDLMFSARCLFRTPVFDTQGDPAWHDAGKRGTA